MINLLEFLLFGQNTGQLVLAASDHKNKATQSEIEAEKDLYKAFDNADVEAILEIPRKERKQLFVTSVSIKFTEDVKSAEFAGGPLGGIKDMAKTKKSLTGAETAEEDDTQGGRGFLVTMSGYSPYKNIGELMDPVGVEEDPNKWGVVTRLLHLDSITDENSLFKLYKKTCKDIEAMMGKKDTESTKALFSIFFSTKIIYHLTTMRLDTISELSTGK